MSDNNGFSGPVAGRPEQGKQDGGPSPVWPDDYAGPADKHDLLMVQSRLTKHILAVEGKLDYKIDVWGRKLRWLLVVNLALGLAGLILWWAR
ncbi:MAG: hypothetical protein N3A57_00360 [Negativicutes bacterium]|nr:hypothetical protein [Negativicutes bacterium]